MQERRFRGSGLASCGYGSPSQKRLAAGHLQLERETRRAALGGVSPATLSRVGEPEHDRRAHRHDPDDAHDGRDIGRALGIARARGRRIGASQVAVAGAGSLPRRSSPTPRGSRRSRPRQDRRCQESPEPQRDLSACAHRRSLFVRRRGGGGFDCRDDSESAGTVIATVPGPSAPPSSASRRG